MARFTEPTAEQREMWNVWVSQRPEILRRVIEEHKIDPWTLYRMKSTQHRVAVVAFDVGKDGRVTVRVNVEGQWNFVAMERTVFGVDPADLEECDLPLPGEPLGSLDLSVEQVRAMLCSCGFKQASAIDPLEGHQPGCHFYRGRPQG